MQETHGFSLETTYRKTNCQKRDFDKSEGWAVINNIKFNKCKCQILQVGWGSVRHMYRMWDERLESSSQKQIWVLGKDSLPQGGQMLSQAPQGSDHNLKPVEVRQLFGQHSQTYGLNFWVGLCVEPGAELDDPQEFLPIQDMLLFCDSMKSANVLGFRRQNPLLSKHCLFFTKQNIYFLIKYVKL